MEQEDRSDIGNFTDVQLVDELTHPPRFDGEFNREYVAALIMEALLRLLVSTRIVPR